MSQTFNPYGLSYFELKGGKDKAYTQTYPIHTAFSFPIGQGDPLNQSASGDGALIAYTAPTAGTLAANTYTVGVFVSVSYTNTQGQLINSSYWPANTATYNGLNATVTLADVPYNIYKIQCNASLGLTGQQVAVGKNYNILINTNAASSANPATGQSQASLNVSTGVAGNTNSNLSLKIVGLAPPQPGQTNAWTDPYPEVLVIINNHVYKPGTVGSN